VAKVYVRLDRAEVGNLLKSPEVGSFLRDIGKKIASADSNYEVQDWTRATRRVVNVVDPRPDARFREMSTGQMARAVARGRS
jgi:hypothetical protein